MLDIYSSTDELVGKLQASVESGAAKGSLAHDEILKA